MRRVLALALAVLALPAQAGASVLVVGDSLEEGTGPLLQRELGDVEVTVDARRGRPSAEGLDVLRARLRPEHEVVVFDLGTNDAPSQPAALAANLAAARELAGGRCMVVASIHRPPLDGVSADGLDGSVRDFVAQTPGAQLADWRAAAGQPGVLAPDGLHGTPEGYALRARLVADAVRGCLGRGAPGEGGAAEPLGPPPRARSRPDRRPPVQTPALLLPAPGATFAAVLASPIRLFTSAGWSLADALTPGTPEPVLGG